MQRSGVRPSVCLCPIDTRQQRRAVGLLLSTLQAPTRSSKYGQRHSGTVVERRSLAGELSLSCARPAADG